MRTEDALLLRSIAVEVRGACGVAPWRVRRPDNGCVRVYGLTSTPRQAVRAGGVRQNASQRGRVVGTSFDLVRTLSASGRQILYFISVLISGRDGKRPC